MANNKVYTDYLMHGRTKGSKNGISTTPGYRAVGQKAKGQWINGRYVYPQTVYPKFGVVTGPRPKEDSAMTYARREGYAKYEAHKAMQNKKLNFVTPKSYGGNVETTQSGAVGQKAKGHWVNGHYVYYEDEARNRAYRQGEANKQGMNQAYANQSMVKRMENARKADVQDQKIYGKKIEGYTRLADISPYERQRLANKYLENNPQHQTAVNQHNANVSGMNAAYERQKSINKATKEANAFDRMKKLSSEKHAHQNAVNQSNAERAALNAIANRSSAKSAHQNAVNQANAERYARDNAFYNSSSHKSFNDWKYDKKLEANKKRSELAEATKAANYEANQRNTRSDIGNAWEDLKQDAKNTFKALKSKKKKKK